jgi:anti-sigma B factor antagonist
MNNQPFSAQVRPETKAVAIDLHGQINSFSEEELNSAYTQAESYNTSKIMLNFSQVDYINSTGIALIVGLLARARKAHRELIVYGLSDHYMEIFHITRLVDFMTVYTDEASALQSLSSSH